MGLYVTALYRDNDNNKYKLLIIRLLIITVLVYFIGLILCHCIMFKCGGTIKQETITMSTKIVRVKQTTSKLLHMENFSYIQKLVHLMLHLSTKNFKSYWLYWIKQSVYMYSTIVHINTHIWSLTVYVVM